MNLFDRISAWSPGVQSVRFAAPAVAAICVISLNSCSEEGSSEIMVTRSISKFERDRPVNVDTTIEERFRFTPSAMNQVSNAPQLAEQGPGSSSGGGTAGSPRLKWDVPEGWSEAGAAAMRDINLSFGPEGIGECYVARLPGSAGGLESNVNRWRKQMGQEAFSEEEIDALPTSEVFGSPATYVSIDGSFTGMGGKGKIDDARMLGMILMTENGALFIKMTGPKELVASNTEKFESFCASLRLQ